MENFAWESRAEYHRTGVEFKGTNKLTCCRMHEGGLFRNRSFQCPMRSLVGRNEQVRWVRIGRNESICQFVCWRIKRAIGASCVDSRLYLWWGLKPSMTQLVVRSILHPSYWWVPNRRICWKGVFCRTLLPINKSAFKFLFSLWPDMKSPKKKEHKCMGDR